ncbi:protein kinase [Ophiostoma piceae UAMH 11346]|uniref:non-specific serine/threonine protein kinase n=1 Tax=Ophiostoma piceae (strain UAMH 11346) TaxID=1262450 RepID=S3CGQ1_OPHP1|nr:protein kinase [Ophiostoma piceae UAMH 11346]
MEGDYQIVALLPDSGTISDMSKHQNVLRYPPNMSLTSEDCVQFPWNYERKYSEGFLIGASNLCDLVIPNEPEVPDFQGLITFNSYYQLIYRDISSSNDGNGTCVTFNNSGSVFRNGFTWILSQTDYIVGENPVIVICISSTLKFKVYIPPPTDNFAANVGSFLSVVGTNDGDVRFENLSLSDDAGSSPLCITKQLGHGLYGNVERRYDVSTGYYTARKTPRTTTRYKDLDTQRSRYWKRELEMQNLIKQFGAGVPNADDYSLYIVQFLYGELTPNPYIELEFVPCGTLHEQHAILKLDDIEIPCVLEQALKGLAFLHDPVLDCIAHRDIKPENILVHSRGLDPELPIHIKLADFGLSKNKDLATSDIGTKKYMAAEVQSSKHQYDASIDIWAVGVLVYELKYGYPTDPNISKQKILCHNIVSAMTKRCRRSGYSEGLAGFVSRYMVLIDPTQRQTARHCLQLFYDHDRLQVSSPVPTSPSYSYRHPAIEEEASYASSSRSYQPLPDIPSVASVSRHHYTSSPRYEAGESSRPLDERIDNEGSSYQQQSRNDSSRSERSHRHGRR